MAHFLKDVLFIKYGDKFYYDRFGSPAGELNMLIETPSLNLLHPLLWKGIDWDFIIIDIRFLKKELNKQKFAIFMNLKERL